MPVKKSIKTKEKEAEIKVEELKAKSEKLLDSLKEELTKDQKDSSLEEPLVSFKINNPIKKLLYWLKDIRKRQTTTFSFKISVPLLALPVFLAAIFGISQLSFNLGKDSGKQAILALPSPTPIIVEKKLPPDPVVVSKAGIVKATYQIPDISETPTPSESSNSAKPTVYPTVLRYILAGQGGSITFLTATPSVSFKKFQNRRVLITGLYDTIKKTLYVQSSKDIEILQ